MTLIRAISATLLAIAALVTANAAHAGEVIRIPLRNSRIDVEATWIQLASADSATQRDLYVPLTPQLKEDLWTVQLEHFINEHPDLDQQQRSVVYEALGLLAAGVLEDNSSDVATRTSDLQQRAASVFPRSWIAAAFGRLGQSSASVTLLRSGIANEIGGGDLPTRHISWYCDCNTDPQQDFCGGLTGPEHCLGGRRVCTFTTGCGWWFTYACDGYCSG